MARPRGLGNDMLLEAALEGLQLQKNRIEEQIRQVRRTLGGRGAATAPQPSSEAALKKRRRGRKKLSAEARKRIAAAQTKRWAEYRKKKKAG